MKTKYHVRFHSRAAHLDTDIELADVLKLSISNGALSANGGPYIFDAVTPQKHPRLATRANTTHSRRLAVDHLKATLCGSFLKEIYEDVVCYMSEILNAAARNGLDPNRLIGEHKVSFEANDILQSDDWRSVVEMVSMSVFRKLENEKSTKKLLQKMNSKLNLGVPLATINAALPYFEIRHLLVHSEGKADVNFCNSFPAFGAVSGKKIKLDNQLLNKAKQRIISLIDAFDQRVVANNIVPAADLQP